MRVFISAGEASGDAYGAAFAREMLRLSPLSSREELIEAVRASRYWPARPSGRTPAESTEKERQGLAELIGYELEEVVPQDLDYDRLERTPWEELPALIYELSPEVRLRGPAFEGIGGARMKDAGVELLANSGTWGAISITQSLKVVPRVLGAFLGAKRRLAQGEPGLFVPIDFGYANIRLARHAKAKGWKVLYFVPPGSWRRDRQGRDLPAITDAISTPFEWSAEILRGMGANAHWFGHPIKQLLRPSGIGVSPMSPTTVSVVGDGSEERDPHGTHRQDNDATAVLAGSREHEISENLPLVASCAGEATFEFALAPGVDVEGFRRRWERLAPGRNDRFTQGDTHGVLRRARAAIVCSGTATLEAALLRCPMVVVYRVSKTVELEAKLIGFKRPKFIALPNILLDRDAVPELVQHDATPEAVRAALTRLLDDGPERARQLAAFEELDTLLGPADAITKTAELALSL